MKNEDKDLPERTYQYGRRIINLFEALPESDSSLVAPSRLQPLRKETDELIRIFVTIIKRAKVE